MTLTPDLILQTGFGFWASRLLLAAVKLGTFTTLADRSMGAGELQSALGLHPRATLDFLDGLVSIGMLQRDGSGTSARYRNTPETALFLDRNRPEYVGGILEMSNDRLFRFWADLDKALLSGQAQNESSRGMQPLFEVLYSDPARLEQFLLAMRGISAGNFAAFAAKFDFSSFRTMCDVGGATGLLSSLVARGNAHLQIRSFDLPAVEPIARRYLVRDGVDERVTAVSGDFFRDPLPRADLITMGMILHDWNLDTKKMLIRKAFDALPEGGAFVVIENLIDDERRENAFGLLMSLNMLIETGDGFDFSFLDFSAWCREAGFRRFDCLHLQGPCSAGIAWK